MLWQKGNKQGIMRCAVLYEESSESESEIKSNDENEKMHKSEIAEQQIADDEREIAEQPIAAESGGVVRRILGYRVSCKINFIRKSNIRVWISWDRWCCFWWRMKALIQAISRTCWKNRMYQRRTFRYDQYDASRWFIIFVPFITLEYSLLRTGRWTVSLFPPFVVICDMIDHPFGFTGAP